MNHTRLGHEEELEISLRELFPKINILHAGVGIELTETAYLEKELSFDQEIA